jgi:hypothetical protein
MRSLVIPSICSFLFATVILAQNDASEDARLIAQLKNVSVAKLDAALPDVRFNQWLQTEAGPSARFEWEVNDCGEQTGSPGQNPSEVPTCVEADACVKDGRQIVIMIAMPPADETKRPAAGGFLCSTGDRA